jgi:hypothetical protein
MNTNANKNDDYGYEKSFALAQLNSNLAALETIICIINSAPNENTRACRTVSVCSPLSSPNRSSRS